MSEIDLLGAVAQVGFPIAVAVFLLWKGYTQDQKYLEVLQQLKTEIAEMGMIFPSLACSDGDLNPMAYQGWVLETGSRVITEAAGHDRYSDQEHHTSYGTIAI